MVATDCPTGPRELLADGRFGRLVPVGDAAALAAAVRAAVHDPVPPDALRARARAYDLDVVGAAWLAVCGLASPERSA